jgi:glycosyltransferase involved in cell wall biosynthesis
LGEVLPDQVPKYLWESDLLVLPTRYDIWGLVINEAMAASLVVVSSMFAYGALEMILNYENGIIVDPTDIKTFSRVLDQIVNDAELRRKISNNAFHYAHNYLHLSVTTKPIVNFILEQLAVE